jgi:hemoglobin
MMNYEFDEMKKDIENRKDLLFFLEAFYKKAFADELIGRFFIEVVPFDLETHIPVNSDFRESVVFGTRGYSKKLFEMHLHNH